MELARRNKHYLSPEGQKEDTTQEKVKMKFANYIAKNRCDERAKMFKKYFIDQ